MKTYLLISIATISLSLSARAEPELKGTPSELSRYLENVPIRETPKTVSIAGEAEVRVPADQAVVTLKVTTENKSLHDALRLNQEVRNKLIAYLKSNNMPTERVHASKFSSTPRFGLFGDKAKSYKVENLVRITVEDEHEFQLAASTVASFAEVQFVGAEFELKDKEAVKAKAVAQACENANQRRSLMEEKFGLSLKATGFSSTPPVLQTATAGKRPYPSGSYYGGGAFGGYSSIQKVEAPAADDVSLFGEMVYTATVMVEYRVEGR
jgi:uncharacterized protein YggE